MPCPYVMRYYHPFPEAIPRLKVGCSRVTHPSATKNQKQALNSPFDLHVLGVPPAFVLSQDQTLHKFVYERGLPRWYQLFTNHSQLLLLCFSLFADFNSYSRSGSCQNRNLRVPVFLSHCSVFKMQVPLLLSSFPSPKQLLYYITSLALCQPFFQKFLNFLRYDCHHFWSLIPDDLFIIAYLQVFVNAFFRFFSTLCKASHLP